MRLTLRTLLSYLDDVLDPAQAKTIGAKVAESEQARDLVERIKQVTRRRRLTTPPTTGPGGMDANTIADYLDNEVTPEQAAEVEQICLASDVHLAEVAACHQILTLVLGEPALVPPTAKQRMYALVKGPESIPFRKPGKAASKDDNDLSSEIEPDQDETLRMGVPAVGAGGIDRNFWLMIGGSILGVALLIVAVWQLVGTGENKPNPKPPGTDQVAQNDKKDDGKDPGKKTDNVGGDDRKRDDKGTGKDKDKDKDKGQDQDKKTPPNGKSSITIETFEIKKDAKGPTLPYAPASDKREAVGKFVFPGLKDPAVLLQSNDKNDWDRVNDKGAPVTSARPLVSLPGSKSVIDLDSGVELTLWGNQPEMTLDSTVFESRVVVHSPGPFHADLTIERGRVILHAKKGGETHVRVRFHDPTNVKEDFVDITLDGSNAAVIVDRYCMLDRDEPFHDDPKDPARKGPVAHLRIFAFEGSAYVRYGGERLRIDRSNQPMLTWQSRQGSMALPQKFAEPPWWKGVPDLPKDSDKQGRAYALAAHKRLADMFTSKEPKSIFVVLAEIDQVIQRNAEKELLAAKFVAPETYALWNHAIRCAVAVDNLGYVFDEFSQEKRPIYIRYLCIQPIQQWMALSRDHDYLFLRVAQDQLRKKNEAQRVTELFHMISTEDALKPATYQHLIDGLNNDLPAIRMLSHFHLVQLVPEGAKIPYDPAMPRGTRIQAVNEWRALLPPGEIRPREPTKTKKDKK